MADPIRFYTDEHVARAVVRGLRRRGVDVTSAVDANLLGASDEEHLEFAANNGLVIFTQDEDFLRLHAAGTEHAGIVYAGQQISVGRIVSGLMLVHQVLTADEMRNRLEFLP
jgi:predicted nuclease of predicted toxin-antitoxin system